MNARKELETPTSCFNRAIESDELVFVLMQRDTAAPATIRFWAECRIATNKNGPRDTQIVEALDLADAMEHARAAAVPRCDHRFVPLRHGRPLKDPQCTLAMGHPGHHVYNRAEYLPVPQPEEEEMPHE